MFQEGFTPAPLDERTRGHLAGLSMLAGRERRRSRTAIVAAARTSADEALAARQARVAEQDAEVERWRVLLAASQARAKAR